MKLCYNKKDSYDLKILLKYLIYILKYQGFLLLLF